MAGPMASQLNTLRNWALSCALRPTWRCRAMMAVPEARRWDLYRHGALLVSGAGVPAGCFNWSRI